MRIISRKAEVERRENIHTRADTHSPNSLAQVTSAGQASTIALEMVNRAIKWQAEDPAFPGKVKVRLKIMAKNLPRC